MYCMIESIGPIFKELHGFNQSQIGMVFLGMVYANAQILTNDVKKLTGDVELGLSWDF